MEEKHSVIRCEKGDIVRIKGWNGTVKVTVLDSSGKIVQVMQSD